VLLDSFYLEKVIFHQQAVDNVKAVIAKEIVLAYSNFLKPFEIYMDAFSMHLGAVITQDNKSIAFFSRKLSKMQKKIQCHRNWTLGHSENTKGVQRNAVGAGHQSLHWSQKSHKRCPGTHLWQSVLLAVTLGGICPPKNPYKRDS
jgi:hypothetical protein